MIREQISDLIAEYIEKTGNHPAFLVMTPKAYIELSAECGFPCEILVYQGLYVVLLPSFTPVQVVGRAPQELEYIYR